MITDVVPNIEGDIGNSIGSPNVTSDTSISTIQEFDMLESETLDANINQCSDLLTTGIVTFMPY